MSQDDPNFALRYNTGKPQIHQVPKSLVTGVAEVLEFGARKYQKHNWRKGNDWNISYDSGMRHMMSWWEGEDIDPESKLHHLKHAAANIAFLMEMVEKEQTQFDDRPKIEVETDEIGEKVLEHCKDQVEKNPEQFEFEFDEYCKETDKSHFAHKVKTPTGHEILVHGNEPISQEQLEKFDRMVRYGLSTYRLSTESE